jgi:hypothetical protein
MPPVAYCKLIKCKNLGTKQVHSNHMGDYGPGTGLMNQSICNLTGKRPGRTKDDECKEEWGD